MSPQALLHGLVPTLESIDVAKLGWITFSKSTKPAFSSQPTMPLHFLSELKLYPRLTVKWTVSFQRQEAMREAASVAVELAWSHWPGHIRWVNTHTETAPWRVFFINRAPCEKTALASLAHLWADIALIKGRVGLRALHLPSRICDIWAYLEPDADGSAGVQAEHTAVEAKNPIENNRCFCWTLVLHTHITQKTKLREVGEYSAGRLNIIFTRYPVLCWYELMT